MKEHIAYFTVDAECGDAEMLAASFQKMQREIEQNPDIYVLVLTGDALPEAEAILGPDGTQTVRERMERLRVPVLAASGKAIPEAYLGCDIVIISENAREEAAKIAEQIAENAPVAVQQIKRCVNVGLRYGQGAGRAYELQAFSLCHSTKDKEIGMHALLNNAADKHFVNE